MKHTANMFCYQCQETAGCKRMYRIRCLRKQPDVAAMQDLLIYVTKGLSAAATQLREENSSVPAETSRMILTNQFTTITNANFDKEAIISRIHETLDRKEELLSSVKNQDSSSGSCFLEWKRGNL